MRPSIPLTATITTDTTKFESCLNYLQPCLEFEFDNSASLLTLPDSLPISRSFTRSEPLRRFESTHLWRSWLHGQDG